MDATNFIYRTMAERDPKKRKVKPSDKGFDLLQLNLLEDTSSDDEDYKPKDLGRDDDEEVDGSSEEGDSIESESGPDDAADGAISGGSATAASPHNLSNLYNPDINAAKLHAARNVRLLVCSVCSGDVSHEHDEIVECDSCTITVHEGCYGITGETETDVESVHSNASSSSTEPWFCDSCKAAVRQPVCELCPNMGGIFKQTDVGRWVHLACALHIPGVAFADTIHLSGVTLFEVPYDRWGLKPCSLCEDERLSRTGICICCDAGMCKTYFHVTCAQAQGLLCEAQNTDETELVDPFYAHCKLHASDKATVKYKRRNWLALQSKIRLMNSQNVAHLSERTTKKLSKARIKWKTEEANKAQPWVPTQKIPRLLTTCPSAVKRLIRKAELLGFSPQSHGISHDPVDIRRKWHIPPAFSVEFISYYLDRNNRMKSMQSRLEELKSQSKQLQDTESVIRAKYEELLNQTDALKSLGSELKRGNKDLWGIVEKLSKRKLMPTKLSELLSQDPEKSTSPGRSNNGGPQSGTKGSKARLSSARASTVFKSCGCCKKSKDQHLLALCDNCKLYFHLYCLDPPLTRMPKKTRFGGWQCSDCTEKDTVSDGEQSNQSLIDAPRRLREQRKGPDKFVPDDEIAFRAGQALPRKRGRKRKADGRRRRRKNKIIAVSPIIATTAEADSVYAQLVAGDENTREGRLSSASGSVTPSEGAKRKGAEECATCKQMGSIKLLVQCDECLNYYHFPCLSPPMKKSPKQRGYQWYCEDCDDSDEEIEEEEEEDEDEDEEDEDDEPEILDEVINPSMA